MRDLIKIGDRVSLVKLDTAKKTLEQKTKSYVSQVLEFVTDEKVKIAMPIENGRIIPLEIGDKYAVRIYTQKGLFQCKSIIIDRFKEGNLFILLIEFTSSLEKCQRRQYFRLETLIDFKVREVTKDEQDIKDNAELTIVEKDELLKSFTFSWKSAIITDISGGGFRFNSGLKVLKGSRINFNLALQVGEEVIEYNLDASVVLANSLLNQTGYYEYRAEFYNITPEQREHIIRFVFEEERRKRRKEKGLN